MLYSELEIYSGKVSLDDDWEDIFSAAGRQLLLLMMMIEKTNKIHLTNNSGPEVTEWWSGNAVSYTHLDVYKRQTSRLEW